jgi:hypothetical protein
MASRLGAFKHIGDLRRVPLAAARSGYPARRERRRHGPQRRRATLYR